MPVDLAQNFGLPAFAGQVHQHVELENGAIGIGELTGSLSIVV